MDYTNLNRACSKDVYPLLNIDHLVDGATEHRMLSFLDAYFGYNQIRMDPIDDIHHQICKLLLQSRVIQTKKTPE